MVYHPHYLPRLLSRLNRSLLTPLPHAKVWEEALIRAWLARVWPRVGKAWRKGVMIVFFDEFGFSFQESLARMWALKGQRPTVQRVERERRVLSTAVRLMLSGKIYKRDFLGITKNEQVSVSLKHLQRHVPRDLILIWDGASIHKSRKTEAYLAEHLEILVEPLPAFAPELNPEGIAMAMSNSCPGRKSHPSS